MKKLLLTFVTFLLIACTHTPQKLQSGMVIGNDLKANRYGTLYFSGQPKLESFSNLKKEGFSTVINLRDPSEYSEGKERSKALESGLKYYNIPFQAKAPLTDSYIQKLTSQVMKVRKTGKVLIHCSSGNRVGVWLGGHFFKDHKYSKLESLKVVKQLGLSHQAALRKLQDYFDTK